MVGDPARGEEAPGGGVDGSLAASGVVLLITPDPTRGGEIVYAIQSQEVPAIQAFSARQAVFWIRRAQPSLTILDLSVDRSRILVGELRREGRAVLAASGDSKARAWALEAGCVDAIYPWLEPNELALKAVRFVRNRHTTPKSGTIVAGPLTVHLERRVLRWRGESIIVSPLLLHLAAYFASRPGELISTRILLEEVWGEPWADLNKVHQAMWRLRKSLGEPVESAFLVGRHPLGYGFFPTAAFDVPSDRAG